MIWMQTNRRKSPKRDTVAHANTPWAPSSPERILMERLRQSSARGPGEVWFFRRGCLRLFYRCFTDLGAEKKDFWCQNGTEKVPKPSKGSQNCVKVSQGTSQNTPWGIGAVKVRQSIPKGSVPWHAMGNYKIIDKITIAKIIKTKCEQKHDFWCRRGAKMHATTMPKVSKNHRQNR